MQQNIYKYLQINNVFSKETERKPLCKQTRSALKKGKINYIIQEMNKFSLEFTGERRKNLDREINYGSSALGMLIK